MMESGWDKCNNVIEIERLSEMNSILSKYEMEDQSERPSKDRAQDKKLLI